MYISRRLNLVWMLVMETGGPGRGSSTSNWSENATWISISRFSGTVSSVVILVIVKIENWDRRGEIAVQRKMPLHSVWWDWFNPKSKNKISTSDYKEIWLWYIIVISKHEFETSILNWNLADGQKFVRHIVFSRLSLHSSASIIRTYPFQIIQFRLQKTCAPILKIRCFFSASQKCSHIYRFF